MKKFNITRGTATSSLSRRTKWAALALLALFGANLAMGQWTHNPNNAVFGCPTITDSVGWVFEVNRVQAAAPDITVMNCRQAPWPAQNLDFSQPIINLTGGAYNGVISEIGAPGSSWSILNVNQAANVTDIIFAQNGTLQRINDYAFNVELPIYTGTQLTIPDSVQFIGAYAFANCKIRSARLSLETARSFLRNINECAFFENDFQGNLTIPDSVRVIENYAFLRSGFVNGLLVLGTQGSNLAFIGAEAFAYNNFRSNTAAAPTGLIIPDSVVTIETAAFYNSDFNGDLVFGSVGAGFTPSLRTIGDDAFNGNRFTTASQLIIPPLVQTIGDYAFHGNDFSQGDLEIPDSVMSIGENAFAHCGFSQQLRLAANLPNSVLTTIGDSAFAGNTFHGNNGLGVPDSVQTIGAHAFDTVFPNHGPLTWMNQRPSLTTIGDYAFAMNRLDQHLVLPATLQTIGAGAFLDNRFNGSLIIGDRVTVIGDSAFESCNFDVYLQLGDSLTSIGAEAFAYNQIQQGVLAFPASLTFVGPCAFSTCLFDAISDWGTLDTIFTRMFDGASFRDNLFEVPYQITTIEEYAFNGCGFGDTVIVRGGVVDIQNNAFARTGAQKISLPTKGVAFGDDVFDLSGIPEIYLRGQYFASAGAVAQNYSGRYIVRVEHVADWNSHTDQNDIQRGNDTWDNIPIDCDIWDWDTHAWTFEPTHPATIFNDQGWIFQVGDFNNELVITECLASPTKPSPLDFSTSIDLAGNSGGAYSIVDIVRPSLMEDHALQVLSLVLPDTVTNIADYAFASCGNATGDLVIPDSVTSIGTHSFFDYHATGTLTIGSGLTSIADGAFQATRFTGPLVIPDNVVNIDDYAFTAASSFTSLSLGNGVTNIGAYAFSELAFDQDLAFPASLVSLGEGAFANNTILGVSSWGSVTVIPERLFFESAITTNMFVIPNQITAIGQYAFSAANFGTDDELGSVVVDNGVTDIQNRAFYGAIVDRISVPSTGVLLGDNVFADASIQSVYFRGEYPSSVGVDIYRVSHLNPPTTSYVKLAFVASWDVESVHHDIVNTFDYWESQHIACEDWDWDEDFLTIPPVQEMWLTVSAIHVVGGDVILSWDPGQVAAIFGAATYTPEVQVSTNLVNWAPCVFSLPPTHGIVDSVELLDAEMPVSEMRFFKVKAIKD